MQTHLNAGKQENRSERLRVGVLLVAGAALLLGAALVTDAAWVGARSGREQGPATLLATASATASDALLGWLALSAALETLAHLPGRLGGACARLSSRVTPALIRRVVATVAGASVGALALPATAMADGGPGGARPVATAPAVGWTTGTQREPASSAVDPAPVVAFTPTRPVVRPVTAPGPLAPTRDTATSRAPGGSAVVHRGDSLWGIAARHLGAGASDAEVAAEWPRWYAANRSVIGADPDVLLPGQVLLVPPPVGGDR